MRLPQQLNLQQMQNTWATYIDPVISNDLVNGQLISQVPLVNGVTIVNHKLGRKLIGWIVVGVNGAASIYDSQASNQRPELTLILNSNAAVTANLWVF